MQDELHVFMVSSSGSGASCILATIFSRRYTFNAQCGLTMWSQLRSCTSCSLEVTIHWDIQLDAKKTATDNFSNVDYVCNVVVAATVGSTLHIYCHVVQCRHSILLTCIVK